MILKKIIFFSKEEKNGNVDGFEANVFLSLIDKTSRGSGKKRRDGGCLYIGEE